MNDVNKLPIVIQDDILSKIYNFYKDPLTKYYKYQLKGETVRVQIKMTNSYE